MTDREPTSGRPAFIAGLAAIHGEPRVKVENPTRRFDHEDRGRCWRRCWVWFINVDGRLGNHNVHIDQYGPDSHGNSRWELGIGCHCTCKQITIVSRHEPTDDEAREALRMAGWPGVIAHA